MATPSLIAAASSADSTAVSEFDHGGLVVLGAEDISAIGGGAAARQGRAVGNADARQRRGRPPLPRLAQGASAQTSVNSQSNHVTIEIHDNGSGNEGQPVESIADGVPGTPNYGRLR